jgi:hypothetical protein
LDGTLREEYWGYPRYFKEEFKQEYLGSFDKT